MDKSNDITCFLTCRVIKQSTVLISKAFKGQLVIPEFSSFTQDITEVEMWLKYAVPC